MKEIECKRKRKELFYKNKHTKRILSKILDFTKKKKENTNHKHETIHAHLLFDIAKIYRGVKYQTTVRSERQLNNDALASRLLN